jgi:hypothetical protein
VKRTGRGESIGVVVHICMGTTQGNSPCSYLYLFFFLQNLRTGGQKVCVEVVGTGGRGEEGGGRLRGRRMNMVQAMYRHVCKWKNDT